MDNLCSKITQTKYPHNRSNKLSTKNLPNKKAVVLAACCGISLLMSTFVTEAATVRFEPSSQVVNLGDVFSMDIVGEDFTSITEGGGLNLSFDPAVLKVNSVALDSATWEFLTNTGSINNIGGTVNDMVFASFSGQSGNFDIGTVFFTALSLGTSNLGLTPSPVNPFAGGGVLLPVTLTDGQVSVVPEPDPLWLLLFGLATVWLTLKRRVVP